MKIGQPFFILEEDGVNPIGAVLYSLCGIFYDNRITKLDHLANFSFINKILMKLADQSYTYFKRPISYYLSFKTKSTQATDSHQID